MEDTQFEYKGEFTIEQRKIMTAQVLQEMRKSKKLLQKEVAAYLNIPATTYNTYESGRTEPPIEILVRLSYLYGTSIDIIVQRNRTYSTTEDLSKQLAEYKAQLEKMEKQIAERGTDDPNISNFFASLNKLADAMTEYSQTEAAQRALNKPLQD